MSTTPFINLDWHLDCTRQIIENHHKNGIMVLQGRTHSGKRRYLVNFSSADDVHEEIGSQTVFRCPPCGTDREILLRLARKIGVEECRETDSRSELVIIERIAERLSATKTTLIINDAQNMSGPLMRSVVGLRRMIEDLDGTLAIVFGTTYSPNYLLSLGLPNEDVSCVFEIPELEEEEILGCLREICPVETADLVRGYEAAEKNSWAVVQSMARQNLGRIGLLTEFAFYVLRDNRGADLNSDSVQAILQRMGNECRQMLRPPVRRSEHQDLLFDE